MSAPLSVGSGTPTIYDQGNIDDGAGVYNYYPGIDINSSGSLGITFMRSGTSSGAYMSTYVTARTPFDPAGTLEPAVLTQAGASNYSDSAGGRAGDLSGINVDPTDGSFWAANEYATGATTDNWGTDIAHFTLGWTNTYTAHASLLVSAGNGISAANFPGYGVWRYTPSTGWQQAIPGNAVSAKALAVNAAGDIVASYDNYGLYITRASGTVQTLWSTNTNNAPNLVGITTTDTVVANFPGFGLQRYTQSSGSWVSLGTADATALDVNAAGDSVAYFPGYGVYIFPGSGGFHLIYSGTATVTLVQIPGDGTVVANFTGYGLQKYYPSNGSWQSLGTADATALDVNENGDIIASFAGYGVCRKIGSGPWVLLTSTGADAVGIDANDQVFADFGNDGVWLHA